MSESNTLEEIKELIAESKKNRNVKETMRLLKIQKKIKANVPPAPPSMSQLKIQTGVEGHRNIAVHVSTDEIEQKLIFDQLESISELATKGDISEARKLELKGLILIRHQDYKTKKKTSSSSKVDEEELVKDLECFSCMSRCHKTKSLTCQNGHTMCDGDDCLVKWIKQNTFDSVDQASKDFNYARLLRNEGRILCPGCAPSNPLDEPNQDQPANETHLLDSVELIKMLSPMLASRFLATKVYVSQMSKICNDNKDMVSERSEGALLLLLVVVVLFLLLLLLLSSSSSSSYPCTLTISFDVSFLFRFQISWSVLLKILIQAWFI